METKLIFLTLTPLRRQWEMVWKMSMATPRPLMLVYFPHPLEQQIITKCFWCLWNRNFIWIPRVHRSQYNTASHGSRGEEMGKQWWGKPVYLELVTKHGYDHLKQCSILKGEKNHVMAERPFRYLPRDQIVKYLLTQLYFFSWWFWDSVCLWFHR